jgi:ribosomal protein L29
MKSQELRNKSIQELEEMLVSKRNEIVENSKKILKGSEKNVKKNLYVRKDIARILTILEDKKLISMIEDKENE